MRFRNKAKEPIAYRDDSGKHFVKPGEEFELVGDQHAPAILSIPGVVLVSEAAEPAEEEKPEQSEEPRRRATVTPT